MLASLRRFVRFPTVSGDPQGRSALTACASWLVVHLRELGFEQVEATSNGGPPLVMARFGRGAGRPKVLIYGHYDVVPVGTGGAWRFPPFGAVIAAGRIHGRGASDDKGQVWAHIGALDAWRRAGVAMPVDVTLVLDGEEEVGSPHLEAALTRYRRSLGADVALVSDTRMLGADQPVLISSLRGSVVLQLTVRTPGHELHTGAFGGAVINPLHVLVDALASLHHHDGRIAVPGFYRSVARPDAATRARLRRHGPTDAAVHRFSGGATLTRDPTWSAFERTTIRPAIVVTGLEGGGMGQHARNAIPRSGRACVNLRVVCDQNPADAARQVVEHIRARLPPGASLHVETQRATPPTRADVNHPATAMVTRALRRVYCERPTVLPTGGTIPAVSMLKRRLGLPVVLMGFSQPDDGIHGSNESFSLAGLWRATDACIHTYRSLAHLAVR